MLPVQSLVKPIKRIQPSLPIAPLGAELEMGVSIGLGNGFGRKFLKHLVEADAPALGKKLQTLMGVIGKAYGQGAHSELLSSKNILGVTIFTWGKINSDFAKSFLFPVIK